MRNVPLAADPAACEHAAPVNNGRSPMRFGWLTLAHSPSPGDDARAIFEQLEQATFAEELGFDGVWLTEHNFTGESIYADPIPFAAALAMRTSRIRIGFAVIQMALRHPVRLATQLSLLDNLTRGRLDIGVGRGTIFNEYEFVGYGLRSDDARERMAEALDVMTRCWTATPLDHKGKYFTARLPELRPVPMQRPHPPIWHSVASAASFRLCGEKGVPILTVRLPVAQIGVRLGQYAEGLAASGLDGDAQKRLLGQAAIWRWVYVGESRAAAEDELVAALVQTRRHMNHSRHDLNPPDFQVDPAMLNPWTDPSFSDEDGIRFALRSGTLIGTPTDVAEQVAELRSAGVGHLLCQMSFGYLDHELIKRSMRRFGEQVMPAFK
jgi:alkanesulfonate monooxygenase SsuD/methylene tetrahydromethanopterin reductase-like flavin-dependent oxidoreductase (luciferase family)